MNDKSLDDLDHPEKPQIPQSIPPYKVLEVFNNELRHYVASIKACVEILSKNPPDDIRQRMIEVISNNVNLMEASRNEIESYLEKHKE